MSRFPKSSNEPIGVFGGPILSPGFMFDASDLRKIYILLKKSFFFLISFFIYSKNTLDTYKLYINCQETQRTSFLLETKTGKN